MKHTEQEIIVIKNAHAKMWELVENQVQKAFIALETFDRELAHRIIAREKMVNAQELVADHHCENFIALFSPVAVDLRFVISIFKINNNLERIGDFAESIAGFVIYHQTRKLDQQLVADLQLKEMMDNAMRMLELSREALIKEDSVIASRVLLMDDLVDQINYNAVKVLADYIVTHPDQASEMLHLHAVIRRIERIGDRSSNIAEDVVFYVDAKELRHLSKALPVTE